MIEDETLLKKIFKVEFKFEEKERRKNNLL